MTLPSVLHQAAFHKKPEVLPERVPLFQKENYLGQIKRVASTALPLLVFHPFIGSKIYLTSELFSLYSAPKNINQILYSTASLTSYFFFQKVHAFMHTISQTRVIHKSLRLHLTQEKKMEAMQDLLRISAGALFLVSTFYAGVQLQLGALIFQTGVELLSSYTEYNKGYYLEAASHALTGYLLYKIVQPNFKQMMKDSLIGNLFNRLAKHAFNLGHLFSVPIHHTIYEGYTLFAKKKLIELSTLYTIPTLAFKASMSLVITPITLSFSTLGALFLKLSGKNYIYQEINSPSGAPKKNASLFNYNVGCLPGEVAEKLTVHDFERSFELRKELLAQKLTEEYQKHDIMLLEEAVDLGFVQNLVEKIQNLGLPAAVYSRISGAPLKPGIASGLVVISKAPLQNFEAHALPNHSTFFNGAFVTFNLPEATVIHSHLKPGEDDAPRFKQLAHIVGWLGRKIGLFIGDYNFSDSAEVPLHRYKTESTMAYPEPNETAPDFVGSTHQDLKVKVEVLKEYEKLELSDHLPLDIEIS